MGRFGPSDLFLDNLRHEDKLGIVGHKSVASATLYDSNDKVERESRVVRLVKSSERSDGGDR